MPVLPLFCSASRFPTSAARRGEAPEVAALKNSEGDLPLHTATRHVTPAWVVAALLAAHPEGATERDESGWTPLMIACVLPALT